MEGGFSDAGYCHDAQAVVYNGPDNEHIGKEIIIGSDAQHVDIIDVTDKSNPILISTIVYENTHYTHQGWLTEDHKYFIVIFCDLSGVLKQLISKMKQESLF